MPPRIQGNLAIKSERKAAPRYRETRKVVSRKVTIPASEKLLYLFMIILCVIIAGSIIFKYAQIYEVNTKIQQFEREIEQLDRENRMLQLEVRQLSDPKRLMQIGQDMGFQTSGDDASGEPLIEPTDTDLALRE